MPEPMLDELDRRLIVATQAGLPLVPRPYDALAATLDIPANEVQARLAALLASGVIRRIGAVPNHYALGYRFNGMTVWDVDDQQIDGLGVQVGALPFVTHCYRRPRKLPDWPYNLFAMVHCKNSEMAAMYVAEIAALLGTACHGHETLFSSRILKKTGLRIAG
jgi:DNA-binding Lrp family transcriptional regulator